MASHNSNYLENFVEDATNTNLMLVKHQSCVTPNTKNYAFLKSRVKTSLVWFFNFKVSGEINSFQMVRTSTRDLRIKYDMLRPVATSLQVHMLM